MGGRRLTRNTGAFAGLVLGLLLAAFALSSLLLPQSAAADYLFDPPESIDMEYDDTRGVLLLTSGSQVLRYDVASRTALSPLNLGGQLWGMDLHPNGQYLVVADRQLVDGMARVHIVNLADESKSTLIFPTEHELETGTFDVAYGKDGSILATTGLNGSGWTSMRTWIPNEGWYSLDLVTAGITRGTVLSPNRDHSIIGIASTGSSAGTFGYYDISTRDLGLADLNQYVFDVAVSPSGQIAVFSYPGTYITAPGSLSTVGVVSRVISYQIAYPVVGVFSPTRSLLYLGWNSGSYQVRSYGLPGLAVVGQYSGVGSFKTPSNEPFVAGRVDISDDGRYLFAKCNEGIYVQDFSQPVFFSERISPTALNPGQASKLSGTLRTRSPITGLRLTATIYVEASPNGSTGWERVGTVTTSDGDFSWTDTPQRTTYYRLYYPGKDGFYGSGYSSTLKVSVSRRTYLASNASPASLKTYDAATVISGTMRADSSTGGPVPNQTVYVQKYSSGAWQTVKRLTTDSGGAVSWTTTPRAATKYRLVYGGQTNAFLASISATVKVMPRAYLSAPVASRYGMRAYAISSKMKPRHKAGSYPVRIYRWKKTSSGKWKSYGYVKAKAYDYRSYTKVRAKTTFPSTGKWRIRAVHPEDSGHLKSKSSYTYLTVK